MNRLNVRGAAACRAAGWALASLLGCSAWLVSGSARAQSDGAMQVTVLRSTAAGIGSADTDSIDSVLLRDLSAIAGIDRPQLSPIEYEEIQLTVGCSDQSRDCLASIASTAQVSGLIVRSLRSTPDGALELELVYFDASSQDDPAHAVASGDATSLSAAVPSLVRKLFGIPEVAVPLAASTTTTDATIAETTTTPTTADEGMNGLTIASIVTLAVGVGIGAAGIVVGSAASSSFDDYKNTDVDDRESARDASNTYDDASSQATVANILMPIGGALVIGGAVMLLIGLNQGDDEDATSPQVSFAPLRNGGALVVSGAL